MQEGTIARRYARALIEVAGDANVVADVQEQISAMSKAIKGQKDLRQVMRNPVFGTEERLKILSQLAHQMQLNEISQKFLTLLVQKDRIKYLDAIVDAYTAEADVLGGRLRAKVISATPLAEGDARRIVDSLEAYMGKTVVAEQEVDSAVLSGVRAQIGGLVFEGTLQARLERMRRQVMAN